MTFSKTGRPTLRPNFPPISSLTSPWGDPFIECSSYPVVCSSTSPSRQPRTSEPSVQISGSFSERPLKSLTFRCPSPRISSGMPSITLLRGRICIERGRLLQAEYWISSGRHYALNLACLQRGLSASYGRGFDQLQSDIRDQAAAALVRSFDRNSLLTALATTVYILLDQRSTVAELAAKVELQLHTLTSSWAD